jgi:hypothetical protein
MNSGSSGRSMRRSAVVTGLLDARQRLVTEIRGGMMRARNSSISAHQAWQTARCTWVSDAPASTITTRIRRRGIGLGFVFHRSSLFKFAGVTTGDPFWGKSFDRITLARVSKCTKVVSF